MKSTIDEKDLNMLEASLLIKTFHDRKHCGDLNCMHCMTFNELLEKLEIDEDELEQHINYDDRYRLDW